MSDSERYIDDQRKTSNGCPVAKRVPRSSANYRVSSKNVAAIDFGTTNCSVSYLTTTDDAKAGPQCLKLNGTHQRVPTAILFNQDGKFVSFGHEARSDYLLGLDDGDRLKYYYFEEIKMSLQLDEVRSCMRVIFEPRRYAQVRFGGSIASACMHNGCALGSACYD